MKKINLLLLTLMSLIILVGCGKSNSIYEYIIDESYTGYITMGTSADYPPYEWPIKLDGKQTLAGIDIEIAKEIAKRVGKNLKIVDKAFDFLLEDLASGKVDFVLAGMNPTPERSQVVDFSNIYYYAQHAIMVTSQTYNNYQTIDSLNTTNIKIGAQLGSIQQEMAEASFDKSVKQFVQSIADLILQLDQGSIQALIVERPVAESYLNKYDNFVILDEVIGSLEDGSAVAVKKGNTILLSAINDVIDDLIQTDKLEQIIVNATLLNETITHGGGYFFLLESEFIIILLKGLLMTLVLALLSVVLGTVLGYFITLLRLSKMKYLNYPAKWYVDIIRGTPLLVQVLLIYSFINLPVYVFIGIDLSNFIPGMLALLINSSAYVSEIIRGGILSIDKGQKEAGLSLGMDDKKIMNKIIMPQAVKNIIPSLGNEFITMIKETSIFMYLGVAELMYSAQIVKTQTYAVKEVYITVAILYLVLTLTTAKVLEKVEKGLRKNDTK